MERENKSPIDKNYSEQPLKIISNNSIQFLNLFYFRRYVNLRIKQMISPLNVSPRQIPFTCYHLNHLWNNFSTSFILLLVKQVV